MRLNNIESLPSRELAPYESLLFLGFAAKDPTVSDEVVERVFMDATISSEDELIQAVQTLEDFRPDIAEQLTTRLSKA
jgi:hypothetical protein